MGEWEMADLPSDLEVATGALSLEDAPSHTPTADLEDGSKR